MKLIVATYEIHAYRFARLSHFFFFFSFSLCTALVLGKSVVFVDVVRTDYNSFAREKVSSCDANVFPRLGIIIAAMGERGGGEKKYANRRTFNFEYMCTLDASP